MFSVGRIVLSKRHANAFANQRRVRLGSIFVDPIQPNPIQSNTRMDPTTSTSESAMLWLIKSCNSFPPFTFFQSKFSRDWSFICQQTTVSFSSLKLLGWLYSL